MKMFLKRPIFAVFLPLLALGILVAACGGSGSPTGNGNPTPTPTATPAIPTTVPTIPTITSGVVVKTAQASVHGQTETILTDVQGRALYYNKNDSATSVTCTGACATTWPALLYTGTGSPTSSGLPGILTAFPANGGLQIEYQGHPLYTYTGDTTPGQVNGDGVGSIWAVAIPGLAIQTSAGGIY
jgi:predicted lipoprotein with Yx(FWY)xxD motif